MTVNCIYITSHGVVHATDSWATKRNLLTGERTTSELTGKPKLVRVPHFKGIMSWFGTIQIDDWNALAWLTEQAAKAPDYKTDEAAKFAETLAADLSEVFYEKNIIAGGPCGMGIHFTFFEDVPDLSEDVPELIFITNYSEITSIASYKVPAQKLQATRRTYHEISGDTRYERHGIAEARKAVYEYLTLVSGLWYTNGDNLLTNMSAQMTEQAVRIFITQRKLKTTEPLRLYGLRALYRAQIACLSQKLLCLENEVLVGEPCHNLMVNPRGEYFSDTTD